MKKTKNKKAKNKAKINTQFTQSDINFWSDAYKTIKEIIKKRG